MTLFGSRDTFAIEVVPLAAPPPEGDPAAAASWTGLKLFVQGRNLFRHEDRDRDQVVEQVCWPVIGLVRWLARCWGPLFHTGAWPIPGTFRNARDVAARMDDLLAADLNAPDDLLERRDAFVMAHSLRAAAGGAALPDVWLSRDGDVVSVAWGDSMDGERPFLLACGEEDVPAQDFALAVHEFITWTDTLLAEAHQQQVAQDRELLAGWLEDFSGVQGAMQALEQSTGLDQASLHDLCARAGLGRISELFELGVEWFQQGTLADPRLSPVAVAFRCAAPVLGPEDLIDLRSRVIAVPPAPAVRARLRGLASSIQPLSRTERDWVQGYHLARSLRAVLQNPRGFLDIEAWFYELGIPVIDLPLADPEIDGGCVSSQDHGPLVFVNPNSRRASSPWGRRVVLAHELCHLLFDVGEAVPLGILSGPWAPPRVERRANAFAIELLLPVLAIEHQCAGQWGAINDEDLQALMDEYQIGLTAASEHLRNMQHPRNRWPA